MINFISLFSFSFFFTTTATASAGEAECSALSGAALQLCELSAEVEDLRGELKEVEDTCDEGCDNAPSEGAIAWSRDIASRIAALEAAIANLESTPGPPGPAGRDGADGAPGVQGPPGPAVEVARSSPLELTLLGGVGGLRIEDLGAVGAEGTVRFGARPWDGLALGVQASGLWAGGTEDGGPNLGFALGGYAAVGGPLALTATGGWREFAKDLRPEGAAEVLQGPYGSLGLEIAPQLWGDGDPPALWVFDLQAGAFDGAFSWNIGTGVRF